MLHRTDGNRSEQTGRFFGLSRVFGAPRDDRLQGQTVLVRGPAEVGVEAVVADGQRAVIGAGLLVLLLPVAAALDQPTLRGAAVNAERRDHQARARDGFGGDFEVGGLGGYGAKVLAAAIPTLVKLMQPEG